MCARIAREEGKLCEMTSTFPHDSFTCNAAYTCTVEGYQEEFQATVTLPSFVMAPRRCRSAWCASGPAAKLAALQAACELLSDPATHSANAHAQSGERQNGSIEDNRFHIKEQIDFNDTVDLTDITQPWPSTMSLLRLNVRGNRRFGILTACGGDFGVATNVESMHMLCTSVAITWPPTDAPAGAEELILRYHEVAFHNMFPHLRPSFMGECDRKSSFALLLQLSGDAEVSLAWAFMKRIVDIDVHRHINEAIETREDDDSEDEGQDVPIASSTPGIEVSSASCEFYSLLNTTMKEKMVAA